MGKIWCDDNARGWPPDFRAIYYIRNESQWVDDSTLDLWFFYMGYPHDHYDSQCPFVYIQTTEPNGIQLPAPRNWCII